MKLAVVVLPATENEPCGWVALVRGGAFLGEVVSWASFDLGNTDSLNAALLVQYETAEAFGGNVMGLYAGAQMPEFVRAAEFGRI